MGHKKVFKENSFRGGGDRAMPCKGLLLFTKQQWCFHIYNKDNKGREKLASQNYLKKQAVEVLFTVFESYKGIFAVFWLLLQKSISNGNICFGKDIIYIASFEKTKIKFVL